MMNRVIEILRTVDRRGIDKVVQYILESNFSTARCNTHHTYRGGLVDHSIEVYNLMIERRGDIPLESVAICALFHDLGKSYKRGFSTAANHPLRSIEILDRCGFQLTAEERSAILNHHKISKYYSSKLHTCLSSSDMTSTGAWKISHSKQPKCSIKRTANYLLYLFSKL
jgi:putative nucleotidyltransferase with HDIG domain